MVKKKPYKIYRIDWLDSCHGSGWVKVENYQPSETLMVSSIGYLIHEDEVSITIVSSYTHATGEIHTAQEIPKCAIVKRKRVRDG